MKECSVWQTEEPQKRLCLLLTTDHLRSCLVFVAKLSIKIASTNGNYVLQIYL